MSTPADPLAAVPPAVTVVEVGPRDGLQNEPETLPVAVRIRLIEALAASGLGVIEAGAFVSPRRVPQMADSDLVLAGLRALDDLRLPVLVPNRTGLERAIAVGAREIALFASASESFSARNLNCSIADSLTRYREVAAVACERGLRLRGYVSCALGCPYEGRITPTAVAKVARSLAEMGCTEIAIADTIGVGTPRALAGVLRAVAIDVPSANIALHAHDTYGQALANVLLALEFGVATIDSAVAGLGGCPYAKGASGNLATEDLVFMLDGMGVTTGIDLNALLAAGRRVCEALGRAPVSRVGRAKAMA